MDMFGYEQLHELAVIYAIVVNKSFEGIVG